MQVDVGSSGTAKSNRSAPSSARTTASDVKQRLGSVAVARTNTAPNSSSVFSRLGNTRK